MKKIVNARITLLTAFFLTAVVLFTSVPAMATNNIDYRVTYKIISNSETPTISRGSSFEADFTFTENGNTSPPPIEKIWVSSPNGSIINLPKEPFENIPTDNSPNDDNTNDHKYKLNIPEKYMRYVGKGPAVLRFKIQYDDHSPFFYANKTITECQPTADSKTDKSDLSLQSYSLDRSGIKEGERFKLNLTLKNNSYLPNNHVTAVLDGLNADEITMDGQLDTKTIGTMAAGETSSFSLPMICNKKMASKNYMLKVQLSSDESPAPAAFNVFVPVTGTKSATESPNDKPNASKPLIIIESYDYGGKPITGGKEFNLGMHFKNTNTATQIENLKITVSSVAGTDDKSVGGAFTPAKSSNTFFIAKVGPGGTFTEQIALIPKADATPNSYGVSISFNYEAVLEGKREAIEATETISIPLTQPDRFEVNGADLQSPMFLGEPGQLNINYVNKGKSKIFNLSVKLDGNFTSGESNSYIGNIESGAGDTFQATLTPSTEGTLKGTATLSYEDANGATKTVVKEFSCEVMPMDNGLDGGINSEPEPMPQQGGPSPWMVGLNIACAVIVGVVVFIIIHKKRKAKKLRLLEDSDDYEDTLANEGK